MDIPYNPGAAMQKMLAQTSSQTKKQPHTRLDLPFVTTDPEEAMDLDDALVATGDEKECTVHIAIADVAANVEIGSKEDKNAEQQGFTRYGKKTKHMFPPELSQGKLSLLPKVDRLALVMSTTIKNGKSGPATFSERIIKSVAKLSYKDADAILKDRKHALHNSYSLLKYASEVFEVERATLGGVFFEELPPRYWIDEEGVLTVLPQNARGNSHKIIQEMMIRVNLEQAAFMKNRLEHAFYRNQGTPKTVSTDNFSLAELVVQAAVGLAEDDPDGSIFLEVVNDILGQAKSAFYAAISTGHAGMGNQHYTHGSSPIRRFADLIVQRIMKALLHAAAQPYSNDKLKKLATKLNEIEKEIKVVLQPLLVY